MIWGLLGLTTCDLGLMSSDLVNNTADLSIKKSLMGQLGKAHGRGYIQG